MSGQEPVAKQLIRLSIKGGLYGLAASVVTKLYLDHAQASLRDMSRLAFYEYRRLLLNKFCGATHEPDEDFDGGERGCIGSESINCARFFIERLERRVLGTQKPQDRLIHSETYESRNLLGVKLADSYVDWDYAFFSCLLGVGLGVAAYVGPYRRFLVECPKGSLMLTSWRHRGVRAEPSLLLNRFGPFKERTYRFTREGREAAVFQPNLLPAAFAPLRRVLDDQFVKHDVSFVRLEPTSFDFAAELTTSDGKHLSARGNLTVLPSDYDKEREVMHGLRHLAGLSSDDIRRRCASVVEYELQHMAEQMTMQTITTDPDGFFVFAQQNAGKALTFLGVRVQHCRTFQIYDADEKFNITRRDIC